MANTEITDQARAIAAATDPAELAQQLIDDLKRWQSSVQARDALRADKAALEAELAEVTAQRDAALARVAEFEVIGDAHCPDLPAPPATRGLRAREILERAVADLVEIGATCRVTGDFETTVPAAMVGAPTLSFSLHATVDVPDEDDW